MSPRGEAQIEIRIRTHGVGTAATAARDVVDGVGRAMAAARPGAMNAHGCQQSRPSKPLGSFDLHICRISCLAWPVHALAGSRQSQMSGWLRLMTCQIG
jgi:hypothetical protein